MFRREFLPSIGQLMAFESAARHGSVSRAAQELSLTQSAISRLIKQLEEQIGTALFHRIRQRVVLSDAGRVYAADLRSSLESLSSATQRVMTLGGSGEVLNLAVLPTFGTLWLIPRLKRFVAAHPGVTVNFESRTEPFDFEREPFDAAIHFGQDVWPGATCHYLLNESVVAVCSPELQRRHRLRQPKDFLTLTLLHQTTRPTQWAEWFAHRNVAAPLAMRGPHFDQFSMLAKAAANGLGLALVPRFFVEDELASGRLVVLSPAPLLTDHAYYLVTPDSRADHKLVHAFCDWLLAEAGHSPHPV